MTKNNKNKKIKPPQVITSGFKQSGGVFQQSVSWGFGCLSSNITFINPYKHAYATSLGAIHAQPIGSEKFELKILKKYTFAVLKIKS
jgi:hypothetical protein